MSKKANKALIGLFVLGALCLVVTGLVVFGSGRLFSDTEKYVLYFDGSVKGLSVGAPVVFRGVKVGSVVDINLLGDLGRMRFTVPVVVEVDRSRFKIVNKPTRKVDYHKMLTDRGLRAQLQLQSLVTGQLMIDFDFYPERPARFVADATGYPQVPTIPSTAEELAQKFERLPLQQLVERANALVGGLEQLVNSPETQKIAHALTLVAADARALLEGMDRQVGLLSSEADKALRSVTAAANRAETVLALKDGPTAALVDNFNQTLVGVRTSLQKFDETLDALGGVVSDERTTYRLQRLLGDLGETSRSLGALIDYLGQHPEALLRGKTNLKGE